MPPAGAFGVARARLTACASRWDAKPGLLLRELSRAASLGDPAYRLLVAPVHSSAAPRLRRMATSHHWEFPATRRAEDSRRVCSSTMPGAVRAQVARGCRIR